MATAPSRARTRPRRLADDAFTTREPRAIAASARALLRSQKTSRNAMGGPRRSAGLAAIVGMAAMFLADGPALPAAEKTSAVKELEFIWKIDTNGYGGYSRLTIRAKYKVLPTDFVVIGRPDLEILSKLEYVGGDLVAADGLRQARIKTSFTVNNHQGASKRRY